MIASVMYLSDHITAEQIVTNHRAQFLIEHDPDWEQWRASWGGSWNLSIEDRGATPFRRVVGDELSYAIGAARIVTAERKGRRVAEWLAAYGEMADYWVEKGKAQGRPVVPAPQGSLPRAAEKSLAVMQAQFALDEAENEWLDERAAGDVEKQ